MPLKVLLNGSIAGSIATLPMTLVMQLGYRMLPSHQQYPLWPSEIVQKLEEDVGAEHRINEKQHIALSLLAHFGYGAAAGTAYAATANRLPSGAMVSGIAYALTVWAVGYLGWLPAIRILVPATEQPKERNALNIAAHIVWGAGLGVIFERLQRYEQNKQ